MDKLRVFFGWSPQSEMPRLYARAYFETKLSEVWNETLMRSSMLLGSPLIGARLDRYSQGPSKIRTAIEEIVRSLPELPPVIRYYDDFEDKIRTIKSSMHYHRFR